MNVNIKQVAIERLAVQHGWKTDSLLDTVVTKQYPTAVGLKQASARIVEGNAQYWLHGEYQSEGRNALSTCMACIRTSFSVSEVQVAVDAFVRDVNATIAETYAARLLAI
jgi:hypothetical protein